MILFIGIKGHLAAQIGALVSKKLHIAGNEQVCKLLENHRKGVTSYQGAWRVLIPRINPLANPIAIRPVKGIPKSDIWRYVVWPLTLVSPGIYFVSFRTVTIIFCETCCSFFQLMTNLLILQICQSSKNVLYH